MRLVRDGNQDLRGKLHLGTLGRVLRCGRVHSGAVPVTKLRQLRNPESYLRRELQLEWLGSVQRPGPVLARSEPAVRKLWEHVMRPELSVGIVQRRRPMRRGYRQHRRLPHLPGQDVQQPMQLERELQPMFRMQYLHSMRHELPVRLPSHELRLQLLLRLELLEQQSGHLPTQLRQQLHILRHELPIRLPSHELRLQLQLRIKLLEQ